MIPYLNRRTVILFSITALYSPALLFRNMLTDDADSVKFFYDSIMGLDWPTLPISKTKNITKSKIDSFTSRFVYENLLPAIDHSHHSSIHDFISEKIKSDVSSEKVYFCDGWLLSETELVVLNIRQAINGPVHS